MQKIGLFGGTFDPVHNGHLAVGETTLTQFHLDQLIYIPAPSPPHKVEGHIAPFYHRLAMLELAIAGEKGLTVSPIEAERHGPSYTIDTLTIIRKRFGTDVTFFYVIGLDAFAEIRTWKDYLFLLQKVSFVVIDRPCPDGTTCEQVVMTELQGYTGPEEGPWVHETSSPIYRLAMAPVAVSSTAVRMLLQKGEPVADLVPEQVLDYIKGNNLYRK